MKTPPRSLTASLSLGLALLLFADGNLQAQTQLRSQLIERTRERQNSAIAQANVESITERLPASVTENETASTVINAVKSRVGEELEGQSTEDLIKAAQNRIQRSREGTPPAATITNATQGAPAPAPAKQAMIPEPTAGVRPPASAPALATPRAPAPPPAGKQLLTQASPVPTPPPGIGSQAPIPAPVPLQPRYEKQKASNSEVMEIESDESVMDNERRLITFTGNVVVTEPRFNLTSDQLDVWMNDDTNLDGSPAAGAETAKEDAPPFKRAIATGGMVTIEKIGADGKIQIAKARKADYDAATGDIVLSGGPPTLQSGSGFVNPSSPDAIIILRADGNHQINGGSGGRNKISIPLKNGPSAPGPSPLSGSLDSISNRNNPR